MKNKAIKTLIVALLATATLAACSNNIDQNLNSQSPTPENQNSSNSEQPVEQVDNTENQGEMIAPLIAAEVYVEGDYIYYNGDIHEDSIQKVKELYTEDTSRIVLNSLGGEINNGMDFGDFIYEKELDVEIRNTAFSSAANYVALAAKTLYLTPDSLLGFHGGATQDDEAYEGIPAEQKAILDEYLKASKEREDEFYKKIGVNQEITIIGQEERFDTKAEDSIGYTYSLDALEALGVENIVLTEDVWNTPTTFVDDSEARLFVIEKQDLE